MEILNWTVETNFHLTFLEKSGKISNIMFLLDPQGARWCLTCRSTSIYFLLNRVRTETVLLQLQVHALVTALLMRTEGRYKMFKILIISDFEIMAFCLFVCFSNLSIATK